MEGIKVLKPIYTVGMVHATPNLWLHVLCHFHIISGDTGTPSMLHHGTLGILSFKSCVLYRVVVSQ
jgi:hypothetical protein